MMRIPFSPPDIGKAEAEAVAAVLETSWITTGPKNEEFSERIAHLCHTTHAVCMNSATACHEMAMRVLGIGPGDEVIVPAYTYSASASVVKHVGAELVLVDIEKGSYHVSYDAIEKAITPRTKAIVPVDLGGVLCDYDRLYDIVERKRGMFTPESELQEKLGRIAIIADGAHSLLAKRPDGKCSGELGDFTSFSFHAVKNITTAEGGALTWRAIDGVDSADLQKKLKLYVCHGQDRNFKPAGEKPFWEYDIEFLGYKHNMTDILAAFGIAQLDRADEIMASRRRIFKRYDTGLSGIDGIRLYNHFGSEGSSCHLYMINFKDRDEAFRNRFMDRMLEFGVTTNVHYKPLPMHTAYKNLGFSINDFPNAYEMFKGEVTLPSYSLMTDEQVDYVIDCIKKVYDEIK